MRISLTLRARMAHEDGDFDFEVLSDDDGTILSDWADVPAVIEPEDEKEDKKENSSPTEAFQEGEMMDAFLVAASTPTVPLSPVAIARIAAGVASKMDHLHYGNNNQENEENDSGDDPMILVDDDDENNEDAKCNIEHNESSSTTTSLSSGEEPPSAEQKFINNERRTLKRFARLEEEMRILREDFAMCLWSLEAVRVYAASLEKQLRIVEGPAAASVSSSSSL